MKDERRRCHRKWLENGQPCKLDKGKDNGGVVTVYVNGMQGDNADGEVIYIVREDGKGGLQYPASSRNLTPIGPTVK